MITEMCVKSTVISVRPNWLRSVDISKVTRFSLCHRHISNGPKSTKTDLFNLCVTRPGDIFVNHKSVGSGSYIYSMI